MAVDLEVNRSTSAAYQRSVAHISKLAGCSVTVFLLPTLAAPMGTTRKGVLHHCTMQQLTLRGANGRNPVLPMKAVGRVVQRGGADWTVKGGHRAVIRAAKFNVRLHEVEKQHLEAAAAAAGQTLTAYVLGAALAAASVTLGRPLPPV